MYFFRMQFVKFYYRFFKLKVWWCHFEGKCNTQHNYEFFWQNREKLKYRFLTFLPVTWVEIELQRPTIHQMNGWNLYFLAYLMPSIQKLNLRGPRTSDISLKFIESPFTTALGGRPLKMSDFFFRVFEPLGSVKVKIRSIVKVKLCISS